MELVEQRRVSRAHVGDEQFGVMGQEGVGGGPVRRLRRHGFAGEARDRRTGSARRHRRSARYRSRSAAARRCAGRARPGGRMAGHKVPGAKSEKGAGSSGRPAGTETAAAWRRRPHLPTIPQGAAPVKMAGPHAPGSARGAPAAFRPWKTGAGRSRSVLLRVHVLVHVDALASHPGLQHPCLPDVRRRHPEQVAVDR